MQGILISILLLEPMMPVTYDMIANQPPTFSDLNLKSSIDYLSPLSFARPVLFEGRGPWLCDAVPMVPFSGTCSGTYLKILKRFRVQLVSFRFANVNPS